MNGEIGYNQLNSKLKEIIDKVKELSIIIGYDNLDDELKLAIDKINSFGDNIDYNDLDDELKNAIDKINNIDGEVKSDVVIEFVNISDNDYNVILK